MNDEEMQQMMSEGHYWHTISDVVDLMITYGTEKVMKDIKRKEEELLSLIMEVEWSCLSLFFV